MSKRETLFCDGFPQEEALLEEEEERPPAPWWEGAAFRLLNCVMVVFFLGATVKLQVTV